jgi:uncharacterized protein YdhG (YjbR/CyaY superfamily)
MDEYLAGIGAEDRVALEKLREVIKAAAPEATEAISWGMPAFKHKGNLVAFAAFREHLSFFPMSTAVMEAYADELGERATGKGTIRFTVDKPLPAALVKKLVKARIKENEERAQRRGGP